jgi:hypothetical protein
MKRRYSRLLAVLAAATMGTLLDFSCTGNPPDTGDNCWFICKAVEKSQTPHVSYASLPLSQAALAKPA